MRAIFFVMALVGLGAQPSALALPPDPPASLIPWPLPATTSTPAAAATSPASAPSPAGVGDDSVPLLSTLPSVEEDDESVAVLPRVTQAEDRASIRPTIELRLAPPASVVAAHRLTLKTGAAGSKDRTRGKLTEEETSFLLPSIDLPSVGLDVLVDELTPPTPEARRWQFANTQGMTWEAQESRQEGDWVILRGGVDVRSGLERIRADEIRLNTVTQRLEADGNVVLDRLDARLTGSRLEYDVALGIGRMFDAMGYTRGELSFTATVAEKIGPTKYRLHQASFTSCTQPLPIWQVKATKATVEIDKFAYLWNPRVFFKKAGAWWLPWIAIPIKQERSTGFMVPRISNSSVKGFSAAEDFFWAINRSTDLTIGGEYWADFGWESTMTGRWFGPGMTDYGFVEGIFRHENDPPLNQKLKQERYDVEWEHRQTLAKWDLTLTGEIGSDQLLKGEPSNRGANGLPSSDYLNPVFNQKISLQRRWGKHSLNIFIENDERETDTSAPAPTPALTTLQACCLFVGGCVEIEPVVCEPPDPPAPLPPTPNLGDSGGVGSVCETASCPPLTVEGRQTRINRQMPMVEWRAAGIQPGGAKWISLNLEGSIGRFERITSDVYRYPYRQVGGDLVVLEFEDDIISHAYQRADFFPQVRFPFGPTFLQVIPEFAMRGTWWSRVEIDGNPTTPLGPADRTLQPINLPVPQGSVITPGYTLGEDEAQFLWGYEAGLAMEGPDFERIYHAGAKPGERKWQHLIEPRIDYTYAPEVDHRFLITGDDKAGWYTRRFATFDSTHQREREGLQHEVALRLTNTLRTKRVVPEGSTEPTTRDMLIWTLSTTWNLEQSENTGVVGVSPFSRNEESRFSSIESDFNIRPTERSYVSLRNTFDVLADDITRTTLVGGVEGGWGYTSMAFSSSRELATLKVNNSEATITGENWFYKGGRIRLGYDITRSIESKGSTQADTPWIYRRLVLGYYNQCAGLQLSFEDNAARALEREKTWTFVVSLKDLGNYLRYRKSARP